jgi:hypothetical protein
MFGAFIKISSKILKMNFEIENNVVILEEKQNILKLPSNTGVYKY